MLVNKKIKDILIDIEKILKVLRNNGIVKEKESFDLSYNRMLVIEDHYICFFYQIYCNVPSAAEFFKAAKQFLKTGACL